MNRLKLFLSLLAPIQVFADCGGVPGKPHNNQDGSLGGFIASTATVARTVKVDSSSTVCERARVQGNARILSGSKISGEAKIEGSPQIVSSTVKGQAKVLGSSRVSNSAICQYSLINFNVKDSNYYCSIFEPEAKDPGELGRKTLAGIDGNANGVRDDLEVWINQNTTNTPEKDLGKIRQHLIAASKALGSAIILSGNGSSARDTYLQGEAQLNCVGTLEDTLLNQLPSKFRVQLYNTKSRLDSWIKIQGSLAGSDINLRQDVCN